MKYRVIMLEVGTKAPEFTAQNQDGDQVSLSDFAGQWVAMWWYPKASTPG